MTTMSEECPTRRRSPAGNAVRGAARIATGWYGQLAGPWLGSTGGHAAGRTRSEYREGLRGELLGIDGQQDDPESGRQPGHQAHQGDDRPARTGGASSRIR